MGRSLPLRQSFSLRLQQNSREEGTAFVRCIGLGQKLLEQAANGCRSGFAQTTCLLRQLRRAVHLDKQHKLWKAAGSFVEVKRPAQVRRRRRSRIVQALASVVYSLLEL